MYNYENFISEGKNKAKSVGSVMKTDNIAVAQTAINYSDESLEMLRRKLYDIFIKNIDRNSSKATIVNKVVSTYVYSLDKGLRIDSEILDRLAKAVGKSTEDINKIFAKETDNIYSQATNYYGTTS